jgi:predicted ArsR family transcriptional regulator
MEAPTPVADLELLKTLAFVRAEPEPPTAADTAVALGVPRSVARWRLERLVESGLLVPGFARRTGRSGPGAGRPAKTYAVAPGAADLELPMRRYPELIRLLIAALPARGRRPRLRDVGRRFGEELARAATVRPARRVETGARRICRALGGLGFQTAAEVSKGRITFITPTCPLRPLVVSDPAAADVDCGMWRSLVAAALPAAGEVHCETHGCLVTESPCRVVVDFSKTAAAELA